MAKKAIARIREVLSTSVSLPPGLAFCVRCHTGDYKGWGRGRMSDTYSVVVIASETGKTEFYTGWGGYHQKTLARLAHGSEDEVVSALSNPRAMLRKLAKDRVDDRKDIAQKEEELQDMRSDAALQFSTGRNIVRFWREKNSKGG